MTEKEDGPEPYLVPEKEANGMTVHRLAEIQKAEKGGSPLELSAEEKAAAERAQARLSSAIAGLRIAGPDWAKMSKMLDDIQPPRPSAADMIRTLKAPAFHVPDLGLDEMVKAKRIEREREEQNSANIQTTAEVMKEMLAAMKAEADQSAARDEDAKSSARSNFWVAFSSMVLAAAAVVTPFIIEAIKGWK